MEYVYELNLPPINQVFLDTFKGFEYDNNPINFHYRNDLNNIIKPEWITFMNINWDHLVYFKKTNSEGTIHTDLEYTDSNTTESSNSLPWAINWVYDGDGLLEFWNFQDIIKYKTVQIGLINGAIYKSDVPPIKSYPMKKDKCFLVNAKYPHKATGFGDRRVISLRTQSLMVGVTWEEIVAKFSNLIV